MRGSQPTAARHRGRQTAQHQDLSHEQDQPGERRRVSNARAQAAADRVLRHSATLLASEPAHPDAGLLGDCVAYRRMWRRSAQLSKNPGRALDNAARDRTYADLHGAGTAILDRVAAQRAQTLDGHRARAAAILAWDEGELVGVVNRTGALEDRLLLAVLVDLVEP